MRNDRDQTRSATTIWVTGVIDVARVVTCGPTRGALIFAFVRSEDGRRWFILPADCEGAPPRRLDRVAFEPDEHGDPRGPRARQVRLLEGDAAAAAGELVDHVEIACAECRQPFLWSAGEQAFYREHRLAPPKKCASCRARRAGAGLACRFVTEWAQRSNRR